MGEVSIVCKRTVVSTKPVKPGKILPLSPLDLIMENHHLEMVYYYRTPLGLGVGEITKKLKESLSEMLTYYPTVTGRLIRNEKGKWMIKCNDAGVRMVECRVTGSVDTWLENVDEEKEKRLIHWEDMFHNPYFWSTFYVQLTEFEEGGLAVGFSCTNLIADPLCATLFIKAWADTTLCGKILVPPFFHSLPKQKLGHTKPKSRPNSNLIRHYKSILESPISPQMGQKSKTVALAFPDHMVQTLVNLARISGPKQSSPFVALAGLLWACISRVKGGTNGLVDMSMCLDMRKELGLDQGYFGNCMIYNRVHGDGIGVDDISQATRAIGEAIGKMENNHEEIMDLIGWLESYDNFSLDPSMDGSDHLLFISLENVDPYSTIFVENYKPLRVSYYIIESVVEKRKVLIFPQNTYEGQLSTVVMVTLPNNEVVKLCEDKLLTRFSPTILMGAK